MTDAETIAAIRDIMCPPDDVDLSSAYNTLDDVAAVLRRAEDARLSEAAVRLGEPTPPPAYVPEDAYLLAYYTSTGAGSGLHHEWYRHASSVFVRVIEIQAASKDIEPFKAARELSAWLASAKMGDTFAPGWEVLFISRLRLDVETEATAGEGFHDDDDPGGFVGVSSATASARDEADRRGVALQRIIDARNYAAVTGEYPDNGGPHDFDDWAASVARDALGGGDL
jgi:hypothetical protein